MKELIALIPENRRKLLEILCEMSELEGFKPQSLSMLSHELRMSHPTVSKIVEELRVQNLVRVHEVGRAKVVVPTEKLKDICEMLK